MKKIVIRINPNQTVIRNYLHFEVQTKTRMQIQNSRKAYYRPRMKAELRKELSYSF